MSTVPFASEASPVSKRLTGFRVLGVINGLELFGHERGNIEALKSLRRSGAEVLVGVNARERGGAVAAELSHQGFETFELPFNPQWSLKFLARHPLLIVQNPLAVWRCSLLFRSKLSSFRATHVHIGSPLAYSYLSLALAATRVPMVYRMGDVPPSRASRFNFAIWRMAVRRASRIVSVSEFIRRAVIETGVAESKIETVFNLAPARSVSRETPPELSDSAPSPAWRLVYVGAISEQKGLIPLVEAVAALNSEGLPIDLDVLGGSQWDSDFRARLLRLIEQHRAGGRIHLHGHVEDPSPFYARAAIHLAPSIVEEGMPNVVLEAKREGTPSIVFPSGGLTELIHHKIDGYVCDEKSADSLIEALRWMLGDEPRLERMRAAARSDHDSRFDQKRFDARWASVYERSAGRSSSLMTARAPHE